MFGRDITTNINDITTISSDITTISSDIITISSDIITISSGNVKNYAATRKLPQSYILKVLWTVDTQIIHLHISYFNGDTHEIKVEWCVWK